MTAPHSRRVRRPGGSASEQQATSVSQSASPAGGDSEKHEARDGKSLRGVCPARSPAEFHVWSALLRARSPVFDVRAGSTALYERDGGNVLSLTNADNDGACDVLLLTGTPLREPVALGGPIVMNTEEELAAAYRELRAGTFLEV